MISILYRRITKERAENHRAPDRFQLRAVIYGGLIALFGTVIGGVSSLITSHIVGENQLEQVRLEQQLMEEAAARESRTRRSEFLISQYKLLFRYLDEAAGGVIFWPTHTLAIEALLYELFEGNRHDVAVDLVDITFALDSNSVEKQAMLRDCIVNIELLEYDEKRLRNAKNFYNIGKRIHDTIDPGDLQAFFNEVKKQAHAKDLSVQERVNQCLSIYAKVLTQHAKNFYSYINDLNDLQIGPADLRSEIMNSLANDPELSEIVPSAG